MNKFKILDDGLVIKKISKAYGNKDVVRDISINIKMKIEKKTYLCTKEIIPSF